MIHVLHYHKNPKLQLSGLKLKKNKKNYKLSYTHCAILRPILNQNQIATRCTSLPFCTVITQIFFCGNTGNGFDTIIFFLVNFSFLYMFSINRCRRFMTENKLFCIYRWRGLPKSQRQSAPFSSHKTLGIKFTQIAAELMETQCKKIEATKRLTSKS